jgi:Flp pilus assembly pilin Flp
MMRRIGLILWHDERGALSFEWTLLVTLLAIGVVGGVTAARDGIIDELGDVAQALLALDDSYTISQPLEVFVDPLGGGVPASTGGGSNSGFQDAALYTDCTRLGAAIQQPSTSDVDS